MQRVAKEQGMVEALKANIAAYTQMYGKEKAGEEFARGWWQYLNNGVAGHNIDEMIANNFRALINLDAEWARNGN